MARGGEKPSFDCTKAKSASARLICADGELARLDSQLGAAFQKKKNALPDSEQAKLVSEQLAWIRDRNKQCGLVNRGNAAVEELALSKLCMSETIRQRIAALGIEDRPGPRNSGSEANTTDDLLKSAAESLRNGEPDRAIAELTRALANDPQNAGAYRMRGSILALKGDYKRAIADYDRAMQLKPDDVNLLIGHGATALALKDVDQAIADFDEAARRAPKLSSDLYIWRSVAWMVKGDAERASAELRRASELSPNVNFQQNGLTTRAQYFKKTGFPEYAAQDCEEALRQNPNNVLARVLLYQAWEETTDLDRGIEFFTKRLQQVQNDFFAYKGRAVLFLKKHELQSALSDIEEAIRSDPKAHDGFRVRGDILKALGRRDEAIASYRTALGLIEPAYPSLRPPIEAALRGLGAPAASSSSDARASAQGSFESVKRQILCSRREMSIGGCGYACTPFFNKETVISLINVDSIEQSLFADSGRTAALLNFLKAKARDYCSAKAGGAPVPDSVWILDDSERDLGSKFFQATFNGRQQGWEVISNIPGAQYQQAQRERSAQLRAEAERVSVEKAIQSCSHDQNDPDVMCVRAGMKVDQFPAQLGLGRAVMSRSVAGALQSDKCFSGHNPVGQYTYGKPLFGDACIFVFLTGPQMGARSGIAYAVLLKNYAIGKFDFLNNAVESLQSKYGPPSALKGDKGGTLGTLDTVVEMQAVWGANANFFQELNWFGRPSEAVAVNPGLLADRIKSAQINKLVVASFYREPGAIAGEVGVDVALIDLPLARENQQALIAQQNASVLRAQELERQRTQKAPF